MEANSPLLNSSKNEMSLCSIYEFIKAVSSHGECKQSGKVFTYVQIPLAGWQFMHAPLPMVSKLQSLPESYQFM